MYSVEYKNSTIHISPTAWGDGLYESNKGTKHPVDSGSIALVPKKILNISYSEYKKFEIIGAFFYFDGELKCVYDDGVIRFGDVEIDTN